MDTLSIGAITLGLAVVLAPVAGAHAAELKVLAGGAMTASLKELGPRFERATGHKLTIHFAGTPELIRQATSTPFDLGVVPVDVMKDAAARAKFAPGIDIARVGYGVAVRAGAPKPDVGTSDAMKQTLLKAQSIALFRRERGGRLRAENIRASRHRRGDEGQDQGCRPIRDRSPRRSPRAMPSSACFSPTS